MKIYFKSNKLKKQLSSASEIKKAFGVNAKRVQSRIDDINASPNLAILMQLPSACCHELTGNRNGEWAVDISANHRMIFEIADDPIPRDKNGVITVLVKEIRLITTTDYH